MTARIITIEVIGSGKNFAAMVRRIQNQNRKYKDAAAGKKKRPRNKRRKK